MAETPSAELAELAALAERRWPELDLGALSPQSEAALAALAARFAAAVARHPARETWLSRKHGILTRLNEQWLKPAPPEWKRPLGALLNQLRRNAESATAATPSAPAQSLPDLDVTLPGQATPMAGAHPVLRVMDEMVAIFLRLGYTAQEGPEMETTFYNFEALNIPAAHPARDDQDTLYLGPDRPEWLLRTHTSPMQVRAMQRQPPPLRVIVPGKVYRRDAPDASHSPMFHQVEGLAVDTGLSLRDLKGTLDEFARAMFGPAVRTRFRASYFPFTEPSAEMDVSCIFCSGAGCRTCKHSGWIEVLGCGMVDPAVFGFVGYDPEMVSGFAFGMGVERMAMVRYGVDDMQRFYTGDLRFLEQFRE